MMQKAKPKQMILGLVGSLLCAVNVMGCYPLVPAWYVALYLEDVSGLFLMGVMYIGMLFFMPMTAVVKYAVVLLVVVAAVRLVEWANEGCPAFMGGLLAAGAAMILSFCGSLMEWKEQPHAVAILLEGVFIFGAVILLNRFFHMILEHPVAISKPEKKEQPQGEKLLNYADSFMGLSKIFHSMSTAGGREAGEDVSQIQSELTGKICAGCDSCAICWERDPEPLYGSLSKMISAVFNGAEGTKEEERELAKYCKKSRDMVEEAVRVFERVSLNRAWYNRLLENRQVIAEQLDAMAYIMQDCAKEEQLLDEEMKHSLSEIHYRAKENGIIIEEIHLIRMVDGHLKLKAVLRSKRGGCVSLKTFVAAVSHILGCRMRGASETKNFISKERTEFTLYEDTRYRSVQGIARQKKEDAVISGDNFSFLEMESGHLLLGLSDGMGSGSAACKESEMVLDLVERFLEAGFSVETAIRMMNSAMVMKGADDIYSTMDLCQVNLYNGRATLYKIGASSTFIKSGERVECIASSTLPVGARAAVDIETQEISLKSGDFVVMMTDGVLEYLHVPDPEETMQEIIESIETNNPGILAKKIMERVMLFTGGRIQDDMTVLATCIWQKNG